jgi:hypothetical protein
MKPAEEEFGWVKVTAPITLALVVAGVATLALGIVPSYLLQLAETAVKLI